MSTDNTGATIALLADSQTVLDCPGVGDGRKLAHKWIADTSNANKWPHHQQCIRCGQTRQIEGSQK